MAIKNINVLKSYFEAGDTPTAAQFQDLIDSFQHKSESVFIVDTDFDEQTGAIFLRFSDDTSFQYTPPATRPQSYIDGLVEALEARVEVVAGKGLSTNDFTTYFKDIVSASRVHYLDEEKHVSAGDRENWDGKQDAEAGKGLSTNDFDNDRAAELDEAKDHYQNDGIHITGDNVNRVFNSLRAWDAGNNITVGMSNVLRVYENEIYQFSPTEPITAPYLVPAAPDADWSKVLELPDAANTVQFQAQATSRQSANIGGGNGQWYLLGSTDNFFDWSIAGNYGTGETPNIPDARSIGGLTLSSNFKKFKSLTFGQTYGDGGHFQLCCIKYKASNALFNTLIDPVILFVLDADLPSYKPTSYTGLVDEGVDAGLGQFGGKILTFIRSLDGQGGFLRPYVTWEIEK